MTNVGKITTEGGQVAEFSPSGWASDDAVLADYLNLMFGVETYLPQHGSFGVRIVNEAAEKLGVKAEIYPRPDQVKPQGAVPGVKTAAEDDDDDEDPWVEKTNDLLDSLEG
jgi:hypothetical protein